MSEATQNLSGDFAVKLSCTSLLLEAWILEPKIISPPSVKPQQEKPKLDKKEEDGEESKDKLEKIIEVEEPDKEKDSFKLDQI